MRKFFKELYKYIWVILIAVMVTLNAYNIRTNTLQINYNARATICLASGVEVLADSTTAFIRTYIKDRSVIKSMINILSARGLENKSYIKLNAKGVSASLENSALNMIEIMKLKQRPSYEYLKSVTVFVTGQILPTAPEKKELIKEEISPFSILNKPASNWCGTGIIVKQDVTNTYILTNKHVAGGYQTKPVKIQILHNKEKIDAQVIKLHKTQDLALLKIRGTLKGKQVVRGLAFPTITEKVYTIGHSLARPFIYGEGVFSGTIMRHDIYQLPCIGGQSGSGVFNSKGEVLGLVYSVSGQRNGYIIQWDNTRANVVKGFYVAEFLKENLK